MTVTAKQLIATAERGDRGRIAELLDGLNEKERKTLAAQIDRKLPTQWGHPRDARLAATLLFTGVASIGEIKREGLWQPALSDHRLADEHLSRVVAGRSEAIRRKLPAAWLSNPWSGPWIAIRRLVRDGVCPHPDDEARWAVAVASGVRGLAKDDVDHHRDLLAVVREDPAVVTGDLGLLLRHEEATRALSGAYADEPPEANAWSWVLCQLAEDGTIARDDLLDEVLRGLERDLPASAVGFAQDVHRRLAPTDDEIAGRAAVYLRLVASPIATTQRLGLAACRRMVDAGLLDGATFATSAAVPLSGTQKNVAVAALQVLERLVSEDPRAAVRGATAALEHARDDVQARGLQLLESLCDRLDADERQSLLGVADIVSPSLRDRVLALAGVAPAPPELDGSAPALDADELARAIEPIPPRVRAALELDQAVSAIRAGEWPRSPLVTDPLALDSDPAPEPITEIDELVGILAGLLEGVGTGGDVERVLAAVALSGSRITDREWTVAVSPVAKRATGLLTDGVGHYTIPGNSVRADLAMLVRCWVDGRPPPALAHDREHPAIPSRTRGLGKLATRLRRGAPGVGSPVNRVVRSPGRHTSIPWAQPDRVVPAVAGFAGLRIWEVARLAADRKARPLLATPTHRAGWVDPLVIVERAAAAVPDGHVLRFDATQALHRIPPGRHDDALAAAAGVPGPLGAALRRRLGSGEEVGDPGLARAATTVAPTGLRITQGLTENGYRDEPVTALVVRPAGGEADVDAVRPTIDDPVGLLAYRLSNPGDLVNGWWGGTAPLFHGVEPLSAAWMATALPSVPGAAAAVAALTVVSMADLDQPRGHPEPIVTHLTDGHPVGAAELADLVAALLLAKASVLRTLATDLIIARTEHGDLDPVAAGHALARLCELGVGTLTRVDGPLRDAAAAGPVLAGVVHGLLTAFVAAVDGTPRGLDVPLAILRDVSVEHRCPVVDPAARRALEAWSRGSSKRATAAKAALGVEGSPALLDAARAALVEGRRRRVQLG